MFDKINKTEGSWKDEKCFNERHEMQNLEFALLGFGLALVQYFLILLPFVPQKIVVYILCHCMLEMGDLLL